MRLQLEGVYRPMLRLRLYGETFSVFDGTRKVSTGMAVWPFEVQRCVRSDGLSG